MSANRGNSPRSLARNSTRALALGLALAPAILLGAGCNGQINPGSTPGSPGSPGAPGSSGSGDPGGAGFGPGSGSPGSGPGSSGPGSSGPGSTGVPGSTGPGGTEPPPAPSAQVACSPDGKDGVGRRSLRRLTVPELEATIRSAFGLDKQQWAGPVVPPDPSSLDGFSNNVDRLTVGPEYARGVLDSGRAVAKLVSSPAILGKLLPCGLGLGTGTEMVPCAQQFVALFGPKLYRRPLTPVEAMRYTDLFLKTGRADFKNFAYWATLTMLQSPRVLYRSEIGKPDATGKVKLTSYEIASALSYTFTGGPPAADLLQLAASDRLQTADQIEAAAKTLVYDAAGAVKPAFAVILQQFANDWVGLSSLSNLQKDPAAFPDFKAVQDSLAEESRQFLASVLFNDKGTPASLLTAPYTFVDAKLAQYYGLPGGAGAGFTKVARPAGSGIGLLAQGSFLAVESHSLKTSPTKRGYFVRTRLMCHAVPPPPPVVGELPAPTEGETTRQRYETLHAGNPGCKGCHNMFDPIGFAFEHFDAGGRYRAMEGRFPIDDSGVLTGTSMGDLSFTGPTELANAVAKLPEVSGCVASYAAAYAFGLSQANASCLVAAATEKLRAGSSLVDFYLALVRSDHFRTRLP